MDGFSLQSVNPRGRIVHAFGIRASDLTEAHRLAVRFASSLVAGAPEGKEWTGWCIDILDGSGRHQISVPMAEARPDGLEPSLVGQHV